MISMSTYSTRVGRGRGGGVVFCWILLRDVNAMVQLRRMRSDCLYSIRHNTEKDCTLSNLTARLSHMTTRKQVLGAHVWRSARAHPPSGRLIVRFMHTYIISSLYARPDPVGLEQGQRDASEKSKLEKSLITTHPISRCGSIDKVQEGRVAGWEMCESRSFSMQTIR